MSILACKSPHQQVVAALLLFLWLLPCVSLQHLPADMLTHLCITQSLSSPHSSNTAEALQCLERFASGLQSLSIRSMCPELGLPVTCGFSQLRRLTIGEFAGKDVPMLCVLPDQLQVYRQGCWAPAGGRASVKGCSCMCYGPAVAHGAWCNDS